MPGKDAALARKAINPGGLGAKPPRPVPRPAQGAAASGDPEEGRRSEGRALRGLPPLRRRTSPAQELRTLSNGWLGFDHNPRAFYHAPHGMSTGDADRPGWAKSVAAFGALAEKVVKKSFFEKFCDNCRQLTLPFRPRPLMMGRLVPRPKRRLPSRADCPRRNAGYRPGVRHALSQEEKSANSNLCVAGGALTRACVRLRIRFPVALRPAGRERFCKTKPILAHPTEGYSTGIRANSRYREISLRGRIVLDATPGIDLACGMLFHKKKKVLTVTCASQGARYKSLCPAPDSVPRRAPACRAGAILQNEANSGSSD